MDQLDCSGLIGGDATTRETALRQLAAGRQRPVPLGTNTHIHTNYSFSCFRSPAEAAWRAWQAGVEIFGINDHYTVEGHAEFGAACAVLGLPATFSIEAVAMDRAAEAEGLLCNDPGNPGRIYLCGKGVTRRDDPRAAATLAELRRHLERRNRAMVARVDGHFQTRLGDAGIGWDSIVAQTPCGNTTERHIALAVVRRLEALAPRPEAFAVAFQRLCDAAPASDDAGRQNQVRGALLKAGKACYEPEDPAAFPSVAALRELYLQLGAIPTYPVLGNPLTGGEQDPEALCDRLAGWGIHALELIPSRNTDERVAAVLAAAARRGWPVFDGTEHNTPAMEPLLTSWGSDPRFRDTFRRSALLLLGHQAACAAGEPGYVDDTGQPTDSSAALIARGAAIVASA